MFGKVRGPGIQGVIWIAIALVLLTASSAAIYFSTRNELLSTYKSAPTCASLSDATAGRNCRYTTTAIVTQVYPNNNEVSFNVPGPYSAFYRALLPIGTEPPSSITVGSQVQVEFWMFRVTRFAGVATVDNPENDPRARDLLTIGLLLALLGLIAVGGALRNWRADHDQPQPVGAMNPVATSDALWR